MNVNSLIPKADLREGMTKFIMITAIAEVAIAGFSYTRYNDTQINPARSVLEDCAKPMPTKPDVVELSSRCDTHKFFHLLLDVDPKLSSDFLKSSNKAQPTDLRINIPDRSKVIKQAETNLQKTKNNRGDHVRNNMLWGLAVVAGGAIIFAAGRSSWRSRASGVGTKSYPDLNY